MTGVRNFLALTGERPTAVEALPSGQTCVGTEGYRVWNVSCRSDQAFYRFQIDDGNGVVLTVRRCGAVRSIPQANGSNRSMALVRARGRAARWMTLLSGHNVRITGEDGSTGRVFAFCGVHPQSKVRWYNIEIDATNGDLLSYTYSGAVRSEHATVDCYEE